MNEKVAGVIAVIVSTLIAITVVLIICIFVYVGITWSVEKSLIRAEVKAEQTIIESNNNRIKPIEVCVERGGVPMTDTFWGGMGDCVFPPKQ